jgi:hypothetical protein
MKKKCVKQFTNQKELIQNTHMGLNLYIAKGLNVNRFVCGQYSTYGEILKNLTIGELKRLSNILHELTWEATTELDKRTG